MKKQESSLMAMMKNSSRCFPIWNGFFQELVDRNLDKVMIDFGLVHQAEYYSSLIFRGSFPRRVKPVLSGGRYDELFKDFGESLPATGFGINVDQLASRMMKDNESSQSNSKSDSSQPANNIRIALTKGRLEKEHR